MGGGLLQLTFQGQMNISLFYNPQISFFNYAYKKHTNFAIENIICYFDKSSGSIDYEEKNLHLIKTITIATNTSLLDDLTTSESKGILKIVENT